jgi:hypothetical protein
MEVKHSKHKAAFCTTFKAYKNLRVTTPVLLLKRGQGGSKWEKWFPKFSFKSENEVMLLKHNAFHLVT